MPREARYISKTGIYHIMVRGINQQQVLFEDEEDYRKYLSILIDCKAICGFKPVSYTHLDVYKRQVWLFFGYISKQ